MIRWDLLLEALGCDITEPITALQPCPCHSTTDPSLRIIATPDGYLFQCPVCAFELDPVQLAAHVHHVSPEQAISLFQPDGPLRTALTGPLPESHLQEYLNQAQSQVLIRRYLESCHGALGSGKGQLLLAGLQSAGLLLTDYPPTLGCLTDGAPAVLPELRHPKYQQDIYAVYPYRIGQQVTALALRGRKAPESREIISICGGKLGVYMGDTVSNDAPAVYVTDNELLATHVYSVGKHYNTKGWPVIAVHGYPLPPQFTKLTRIYLMNHETAPLQLAQAISVYNTPQLVLGRPDNPDVFVADLPRQIPPDAFLATDPRAVRLQRWLARQFITLHKQSKLLGVRTALRNVPSFNPQPICAELQRMKADPALIAFLETTPDAGKQCAILSNGYTVYRTPSGFMAALNPADPPTIQLSGWTFQVVSIIRDGANQFYRCLITVPHQPSVVTLLSENAFSGAVTLRQAVSNAYGARGTHVVLPISRRSRCDWAEVRDVFAMKDEVAVVQAVHRLGTTEAGTIELPHMTLLPRDSRLEHQHKILTPHPVTAIYDGIRPFQRRDPRLTGCTELWRHETPGAVALGACIGHLFFGLGQALAYRRAGRQPPYQHLLLVDPREQTWLPFLGQLLWLFSGAPRAHRIVHGDNMANRSYAARLGDLCWPLLAEGRAAPFWEFLQACSTNVIAVTPIDFVDNPKATAPRVTYLAADHDPMPVPGELAPGLLSRVQIELPELMSQFMGYAANTEIEEWAAMTHPGRDTYLALAHMLECEPGALINDMAVEAYTNRTITLLPEFFNRLHDTMYMSVKQPCSVYEVTTDAPPQYGVMAYIYQNVVFLDKAVLSVLNKGTQYRLSEQRVSKQLQDYGYLVPVSDAQPLPVEHGRFWALSRDVWEQRVRRPARTIEIYRPAFEKVS